MFKLDSNQLVDLPPEIADLRLLEELSLSKNRLKELPMRIGNCNLLRHLSVNDNKLATIPESIGDCGKALKTLHLHGNCFTSFPCSFIKLTKLDELSLEWFLYAKPPKPKLVKRHSSNSQAD